MPQTALQRAMAMFDNVSSSQPKPKSWWDTAKDFGSAALESGKGIAEGFGDMARTSFGDPVAANKLGEGLLSDVEDIKKKPSETGMVLGEQATGIPFRQLSDELGRGDYAKAAGHAVLPAALLGLGAKYLHGEPNVEAPPPSAPPIRGLLPAAEAPHPRAIYPDVTMDLGNKPSPRFYGGDRGVVDARTPQLEDVGPVNPRMGGKGQGTVLPQEVNQLQSVDPITKANYSGTGEPLPPRNVPSSAGMDPFKGTPYRAFDALVPDRYKTTDNIQPFEGHPVEQPKPAFYPPEDPRAQPPFSGGNIGDVNGPIDPRQQPVAPQPKSVGSGKTARLTKKKNSQGVSVPGLDDDSLAPAADQVRRDMQSTVVDKPTADAAAAARPYGKLSDNDLMTLGTRGDAAAIKEMIARKRGVSPVGNVDPSSPAPSFRDKLTDERGMVDLTGKKGIPPDPRLIEEVLDEARSNEVETLRENGEHKTRSPEDLDGQARVNAYHNAASYAEAQGVDPVTIKQIMVDRWFGGHTPDGKGGWIAPKSKTILNDETGSANIKDVFDTAGDAWKKVFHPIDFNAPTNGSNLFHKSVNPVFDTNFSNWVNARKASAVEGLLKRREFADLDSRGMQGIHDFQAGLKGGRFQDVEKYLNAKHQQLTDTGVKLGFRENYLPQLWDNSADEVFQVQKRLGLSPQFTIQRVLENYQKGIQAGLKPKFQNIGQLMGWYESRANKAIADRQFFDHLRGTGQIAPDSRAPQDWKTLNPDNFPVQKFKTAKGEYVTKLYKAPGPIAESINNYLVEGHPAARNLAKVGSITKNTVMSSGVPLTGLNAHGLNIAARNVMANGILRGGSEAMKYLLKPGTAELTKNPMTWVGGAIDKLAPWESAKDWLNKNLAKAPDAVHHGLTFTTEEHEPGVTGSTNMLAQPKTKIGAAFNKVLAFHGKYFEDPLFQNIIPALKLKHWDALTQDLMKQGLSEDAAKRNAAENMNNLYGGINWEAMQRSRDLQNLLRGVILAPDWLESNYRMGKGMASTLRDPRNPQGLTYKRVAAHLIGAYVAANVMNYAVNGDFMWNNEPGHALDIKLGSTGGKTRYIRPFGTAADFARLPFDTLAGIKQGDLSPAGKILKNRLSTIARPAVDLGMNQDAFGKPILGPDEYGHSRTIPQQLGAAGREVTNAVTPQYVKAPVNLATGQAGSKEEAILGAVEAPVRYSRESTKRTSRYRPVRRRPSRQE